MNWPGRCAVVIPCLNEERQVAEVARAARAVIEMVVVVDDGSTDETAGRAREAGAKVIRHAARMGKGAALRTGFDFAARHGIEWALAMDGDGQHAGCDIPRFLGPAEQGKARMIIGNRFARGGRMPLVRRWVNRWMSHRIGAFCGMEIPDSQCGFRMVHLPSWQTLSFSADGFEVESELTIRFAAAGFALAFVPVEARYANERSKIQPVRDTIRWLAWWLAIRAELGARSCAWPRPQLSHDGAV